MADERKSAKQEALDELKKERTDKMKHTYKNKLKELRNAEKVVVNIKKEIEAMDDKFAQEEGA
jgi:hypothetical protein